MTPDTNEYWRGSVDTSLKEIKDNLIEIKVSLKHNDTRFDKIESKMSSWVTIAKVTKALILTIGAIAAFKFGDISGIWSTIAKG